VKLRGLYAITPEVLGTEAGTDALIAAVRAALDGGAAVLQYRNKQADAATRREQAGALLGFARRSGVPLIVNDDVELAESIDADGVHVGKDDAEVAAARRRLPGKLLGVSCYASLPRARDAVAAGADYVAFGSVYPSPTKPGAVCAPLDLFREGRALGVPLVAIGGITVANASVMMDAGADCVAVISGLFGAPDVRRRAAEFARLFATSPAVSP
jgi:thiamine-phosphate pyrophosphorylase